MKKSLTDYQVYLLLIGYTQTDNYNPYNYNAIDTIYSLAIEGQIDEAIKMEKSFLKVIHSILFESRINVLLQKKEMRIKRNIITGEC